MGPWDEHKIVLDVKLIVIMLILLNQFNYPNIIFSSVFSNVFENNADDIKTDQIHSGIHLLKQGMVILLYSYF